MKFFIACLVSIAAQSISTLSELEESQDNVDFYYTVRANQLKDGDNVRIFSREDDIFGVLMEMQTTMERETFVPVGWSNYLSVEDGAD